MENGSDGEAVFVIKLRPDLVKHPSIQNDIADVLISLYRLFGPYNPEAEYVWVADTDNGGLWLGIVELNPEIEEDEPEEEFLPPEEMTPKRPTGPGSGFSEEDLE